MLIREIGTHIRQQCFKGKVILLLGARQVGKTTLLKQLQSDMNQPSIWLNADEPDIREEITNALTSTQLLQMVGKNKKLVIIDEAQQIAGIGMKLKLLHDTRPDIQIIATGSSSFSLSNQANEPLTGRKKTYYLYPISFAEVVKNTSILESKRLLQTRLIFGSYPEVVNHPGGEKEILREIVDSYLYKDLLSLEGIRKSGHLQKIIQALAFQLGNEVNFHELAQVVGNITPATVEAYLDLLEQAFVIFKLPAFNRNLRNELKKGKKYFFYDNGIRNAVINHFAPISLRIDNGALWENYLISERLKYNHYSSNYYNTYFWRTHDQAEIDYIEEHDGFLHAYEIKWNKEKAHFPTSFREAYPQHHTQIINQKNYIEFISNPEL